MSSPFATPVEAAQGYARWITRAGFADSTKDSYIAKVTAFAEWMEEAGDQYEGALRDEDVRNYAARDYRRVLLTVRKLSPASVATQMAALGSFFEWLGIGRPEGVGVEVPRNKRLGITDEDTLRRILRIARRRGARDFALVCLIALAGPRLSEVTALDVDDVLVNGRTGIVEVRYGKGGEPRTLSGLSPLLRKALAEWIAERRTQPNAAGEPAFFVSREGRRLANRTVQHVVAKIGQEAGVDLTAHKLRHTYGRRFIEKGGDVVALKETMGHRHLSTTAIYTQPSAEYIESQLAQMDVDL